MTVLDLETDRKRVKRLECPLCSTYPISQSITDDDEPGWVEHPQMALNRPVQLQSLLVPNQENGCCYVLLKSVQAKRSVISVFFKNEDGQLERLLNRYAILPDYLVKILASPLLYIVLHEGDLASTTEDLLPPSDLGKYSLFKTLTEEEKAGLQEAFLEASIVHVDNYLTGPVIHGEDDEWAAEGPPDFSQIRRLLPSSPASLIQPEIHDPGFVKLLEQITGLDLALPQVPLQVWSLSAGSYRLLPGGKNRDTQHGLDLYLCLESTESNDASTEEWGEVLYVADETGEVVGRVAPRAGRLSLAYRTEGASRFIRYIPKEAGDFDAKLLVITYPVIDQE